MAINDVINNVKINNEETDIDTSAPSNKIVQQTSISCNFDIDDETLGIPNIKIFGVGGGGNNIVEYLSKLRNWPLNVKFWALNTDKKTLIKLKQNQLNSSLFLIGQKQLKGYGSGGDPTIGKEAFNENKDQINQILSDDTDILFIIAGLGKGTGSGVSPEIAKIAKAKGITTIGIVTIPSFEVEGRKIYENALISYDELQSHCDSLYAISNEKIISSSTNSSFLDQLSKGNKEVGSTISDFVDIVAKAGDFNVDFHDLQSFFKNNKYFFHSVISLEKKSDTDRLGDLLINTINNSYSNIEFNLKEIEAVVNFKINKETSADIIGETKNILEEISNNPNIKITYGIEQNNIGDNVEISLFISNSHQMQQTSSVEKKIIPTPKTSRICAYSSREGGVSLSRVKTGRVKSKITEKLFDFEPDEKYN